MEEYHSLEIESKDASSSYKGGRDKPRLVSLPKKDGKRKRGRPSGSTTRKGKSLVNQSRRTRPRVGNKPAKINENESDKDASSEDKEDYKITSINSGNAEMVENKGRSGTINKPRRTRAQIRSKPAEIGGDELDKGASSKEQMPNVDSEVSRSKHEPYETVKDSASERQKLDESLITEHSKHGQRFEETDEVGSGSGTQYTAPIEDTVDPVQAMLLNMVPILATKKAECSIPVPEEGHPKGPDPNRGVETVPLDDGTQPVKKKKVSYKDLASELLKDW